MAAVEQEQELKKTTGANPFEIPNIVLEVDTPSGKSIKVEATAADCVIDVRQFLLDIPDTCDLTSYHLEHEGEVWNDFFELAEYPKLFRENTVNRIKISQDHYDERASHTHIRRLREIMTKPPSGGSGSTFVSAYVQNELDMAKSKTGSYEQEMKAVPPPSLTDFHVQKKKTKLPQCLKNIRFSAWNPPPGNRRHLGDLVYLEINTFEDNMLFITSAVDGFFLNQSTSEQFNAAPASPSYHSQTLTGLLKKASPTFHGRYYNLISSQAAIHPFESMDIPQSRPSWAKQCEEHTYDWNRAEDAVLCSYGMETRGVTRDWNEEYQSCKELPNDTPQDRILRDRTLYRIYFEFVEAATKGACAVVRGDIPPINPVEAKRSHVFIHNNIFFSLAIDGRNLYTTVGGDAVSHALAKHDLKGIQQIELMEIPELHTLATIVVDYCGQRVICQSMIPGIFHGERMSRHAYGSMDQGENLQCKEDFHELLSKYAVPLRLKEHKVADQAGKEVSLYTCVDSKGIIGSDDRKYLLDCIRMTPRDANYPDASKHIHYVHRPECVAAYCRTMELLGLVEFIQEEKKKRAVATPAPATGGDEATGEGEGEANGEAKGGEAKDKKKEDVFKPMNEEEKVDFDKRQKQHMETLSAGLIFNTDVFTDTNLTNSPDEIKADEEGVRAMSVWLKDQQIPTMVKEMVQQSVLPVDGQSLSACFHTRGVNMRYLSHVAAKLETAGAKHLSELCVRDMIVRVTKRLLAKGLQTVSPANSKRERFLSPFVVRFLSAFLGSHAGGKGLSDDQLKCARSVCASTQEAEKQANEVTRKEEQRQFEERQEKEKQRDIGFQMPAVLPEEEESAAVSKKTRKARKKKTNTNSEGVVVKLQDGKRAPNDAIAPANLWESIRQGVLDKFGHELPARMHLNRDQKRAILRSLCISTGIQIQAREYEWSSRTPFETADVLDLFPVVKSSPPPSKDAQMALQAGKYHLSKGNVYMAYKLLQEASGFHNQVYGPMHPESAECFSYLAQSLFQAENFAHAAENQERAVIIMERIFGLDHPKTASGHNSLALYLHASGESQKALGHARRAAYLFDLMSPAHPDSAATHTNLALLLQEVGQAKASMLHLQTALKRNVTAFGKQSAQAARAHEAMAQASAHQGFFRQAVDHEKMAKGIFEKQGEAAAPRVAQCKTLQAQYASQAVKAEQNGPLVKRVMGSKRTGWMVLYSDEWAPKVSMNELRYHQQVLANALAARQRAADAAANGNNKQLKNEGDSTQTPAEPVAVKSAKQLLQAAPAAAAPAAAAEAPAMSKSKKRRNKKKSQAAKKAAAKA